MSKIRWKEDFGAYRDLWGWLGYLGKSQICEINIRHELNFYPTCEIEFYTKLSSAKRGAERMLDKFLKDAGLGVKG